MNAVLLVALPLLAAFVSIVTKKAAGYILLSVGLVNFALALYLPDGLVVISGFAQPIGISLLLDTYSRIAVLVVDGLLLAISAITLKSHKKYATILILTFAGLNGLLLTVDLFNFYVFLEISAIAAYIITTTNKKPMSTLRYIVLGAIGSSLFLFGVVILYAMYGTLSTIGMIEAVQASGNYSDLVLPFTLMFVGLGVEAKLLPFNSWVRGVLNSSDILSGPVIAGVYAATMSFAIGRLINNLFVFEGTLLTVILVLLVAGVIIGDLMAFASTKVREILLFSSVAQASIVMILFVNGIVIWAVYLTILNAVSKTAMFLIINQANHDIKSDEVEEMRGIFANNKLVGTAYTLITLSVMGLPLLAGFVVKLNFLTSLAAMDKVWIIALILIGSLIEGIYFVRLLVKLWYTSEKEVNISFASCFKIFAVVVAAGLLVLGTYSAPFDSMDASIDTVSKVVQNG